MTTAGRNLVTRAPANSATTTQPGSGLQLVAICQSIGCSAAVISWVLLGPSVGPVDRPAFRGYCEALGQGNDLLDRRVGKAAKAFNQRNFLLI
jgi:hypothetical protein